MTSKDFTEQGIAALKEGDKSQAHDLLRQATELDPTNAKAWYFLSRTQTSTAEKRVSLQKTLEIMPNNKPAREALDNLPSDDEDFSEFEDDEPVSAGYNPTSMGAYGTGTKPKIGGFQFPVAIPDAPDEVEPRTILDEFIATFKNGVEILRRTPGVYPMEIQRATWWRFWQYVVIAWIISGIASTISSVILQAQLAAAFGEISSVFNDTVFQPPNVINILLTLILTIPIGIVSLYAGIYASHRWITSNRNGQGSLVAHAYAMMLPSVTASIIGNIAGLVFIIAPLLAGLVGILMFILAIYALYIASGGISIVHKVDKNTGYWTMGVMLLVQIITGLLVGLILSPLILTSGLSFL
jgi:hypothetical protein